MRDEIELNDIHVAVFSVVSGNNGNDDDDEAPGKQV